MIDYTQDVHASGSLSIDCEAVLAAQGEDRNVLILTRIDPMRRFDGKQARYQLEHRWLSQPCADPSDEAWVCVEGQDYTYWQAQELGGLVHRGQPRPDANLFEHFNLF